MKCLFLVFLQFFISGMCATSDLLSLQTANKKLSYVFAIWVSNVSKNVRVRVWIVFQNLSSNCKAVGAKTTENEFFAR